MILLLAALAHAEPCAPAMAVGLVPAPGAVDVPLDIELAAAIGTGCGVAAQTWTFELLEGETVVHTESVAYEGGNRLASAPPADLLANTAYVVRVYPDGGSGQATEGGFTTGDQPAEPLTGVPELSFVTGTWYTSESLSIETDIVPAPYPAEFTLVGFALEPGGPVLAIASTGGGMWASVPREQAPEEICAIPVQWSADGTRVEGAEVCAEVQEIRDRGCNTSGIVPGAFPALLALLVMRRRRGSVGWKSTATE